MKKTKKGTYGYIRNERKRRLLITLASFAIPLIIYVTGYIQTKTRLNLFTFVAILGCIPAAQAMVSFIMIAMQKPFSQKNYEMSSAAAGNLTAAYEMIFTAYEHTTNVGALVVCGDHVVCYTADDKSEPAKLEKHIGKLLTANGFGDVQVKGDERHEKLREPCERYLCKAGLPARGAYVYAGFPLSGSDARCRWCFIYFLRSACRKAGR